MATEYMNRGSLKSFVRSCGGRLDECLLRHIARQALEGLKYLHECSLVHRDIKV